MDSAGSAALDGVDSRLHRSLSGGSGLSGYTGTSGGASRYSKGVVLISAEEFDAALEGTEMGGERRWGLFPPWRLGRLLVVGPCGQQQRPRLCVTAQASQVVGPASHPAVIIQPPCCCRRRPSPLAAVKRAVLRAQYRVRLLVESPAFNNVFLVAILANTVVLAIEHDGMRPRWALALSGPGRGSANQLP